MLHVAPVSRLSMALEQILWSLTRLEFDIQNVEEIFSGGLQPTMLANFSEKCRSWK